MSEAKAKASYTIRQTIGGPNSYDYEVLSFEIEAPLASAEEEYLKVVSDNLFTDCRRACIENSTKAKLKKAKDKHE